MNLIKKLSFIILVCTFFLTPFAIVPENVNAANSLWEDQEGFGGENEIGEKFNSSGQAVPLQMVVINIIKVMLGFLGIIFLTIIIFSGFKYMTAGGSEDKVKEALVGIRNGIIGLLIILMSYAITNFVTTCAIDATTKDGSGPWYCSIK